MIRSQPVWGMTETSWTDAIISNLSHHLNRSRLKKTGHTHVNTFYREIIVLLRTPCFSWNSLSNETVLMELVLDEAMKDRLFETILNKPDVFYRNQQKDEPDLTNEEKKRILRDLFDKAPSVFLDRYHSHISKGMFWFWTCFHYSFQNLLIASQRPKDVSLIWIWFLRGRMKIIAWFGIDALQQWRSWNRVITSLLWRCEKELPFCSTQW